MGAVKNFFQSVIDTYDNEKAKTESIVEIHEALDDAIEKLLQKGYHLPDIGVVSLVIASKIMMWDDEIRDKYSSMEEIYRESKLGWQNGIGRKIPK